MLCAGQLFDHKRTDSVEAEEEDGGGKTGSGSEMAGTQCNNTMASRRERAFRSSSWGYEGGGYRCQYGNISCSRTTSITNRGPSEGETSEAWDTPISFLPSFLPSLKPKRGAKLDRGRPRRVDTTTRTPNEQNDTARMKRNETSTYQLTAPIIPPAHRKQEHVDPKLLREGRRGRAGRAIERGWDRMGGLARRERGGGAVGGRERGAEQLEGGREREREGVEHNKESTTDEAHPAHPPEPRKLAFALEGDKNGKESRGGYAIRVRPDEKGWEEKAKKKAREGVRRGEIIQSEESVAHKVGEKESAGKHADVTTIVCRVLAEALGWVLLCKTRTRGDESECGVLRRARVVRERWWIVQEGRAYSVRIKSRKVSGELSAILAPPCDGVVERFGDGAGRREHKQALVGGGASMLARERERKIKNAKKKKVWGRVPTEHLVHARDEGLLVRRDEPMRSAMGSWTVPPKTAVERNEVRSSECTRMRVQNSPGMKPKDQNLGLETNKTERQTYDGLCAVPGEGALDAVPGGARRGALQHIQPAERGPLLVTAAAPHERRVRTNGARRPRTAGVRGVHEVGAEADVVVTPTAR
ncbi:hypothetical protein K438DRAFT_1779248 [Mycena galopus ATCC 62051]|nr:hypothetical protein K438DRAFT_1779248 [Mycena galopus ATCC 62051]